MIGDALLLCDEFSIKIYTPFYPQSADSLTTAELVSDWY